MKFKTILPLFISAIALLVALASLAQPARSRPLGDISNLDGLHLQGSFGTATPIFLADQQGTGRVLELRDNATPVFSVDDGGAVSQSGAMDLDSTLNVDGNVSSATGAFTITDNVLIDGQADALQLTVQGYTTQTTNLLTLEQSDGTDQFTVDNSGNVGIEGTLTLENDETIANSTDGFISYTGGQLWSTTTITASDGDTITPTTYTLYNIDTAGAVTITLAACTEGGPVIIAGDDANDITIADSNIRTDDGNAAVVGQYDIFAAICVDSEWLQIANATNQ